MADTTFFGVLVILFGVVGLIWPRLYFKINYVTLADAEMSDIGSAVYRVVAIGVVFVGFLLFLNN